MTHDSAPQSAHGAMGANAACQGQPSSLSQASPDLDLALNAEPDTDPTFAHIPVLAAAVVDGLSVQSGGHYLDATLGGGGHSRLLLQAAEIHLTALDHDQQAIAAAQKALSNWGDRITYHHINFADFDPGNLRFDGILADLGVSSPQFDTPERGFSFRHDAPLDMRMDQTQDVTAAELINTWDEVDLAHIFYTYGEERLSRKLARRIVEKRPLHTTLQLAEVIFYSVPPKYRYGRIHPATRVFQALRIAVNRELEVLETFLHTAPTWLKPGGRIAVISFHSLEDRRVKHTLKENPDLRVLTKKPIIADEAEVAQNGRSRSAKLRLAERNRD